MTRMRSILPGAGTSLVLVLTACGGTPPPLASNATPGVGSSPPAVAGNAPAVSSPAVASSSPVGGNRSSSPAVASNPPGSTPRAVASTSPGAGSSGAGPGVVAVGSGTPATKVQETDKLTFEPASVTVKVGDIVGFTNMGIAPHNVTFAAGLASPMMNGGDSFLVKFTRSGTYKYVCTIHKGMEGTVTAG